MNEGIIARFRTMSIARGSVLTGHVLSSLIQTMVGLAIVLGVAILVGFRPDATVVEWIAAIGVLAMATFALVWLSVAMGLSAKSVESASNTPDAAGPPAVLRQRIRARPTRCPPG